MNRKAFRKIFLPSVIFLFSVFVLGQSAWACDEPDYHDNQCYKQLDIKWVDLDLVGNWIYIWGEHFDNGDPPVVTLAGIPLEVDFNLSNEQWIVAKLPSVPKDIPYGQYSLRVSTGDGHKCKDKYSVKIHPAPPEKPPCEPCPPTCECPQPTCTCPKATFTSTTLTKDLLVNVPTIATPPDPMPEGWRPLFQDATLDCPSGTKLTGGGFEVLLTPTLPTSNILTRLHILASKPSDSLNGWFVRGLITFGEFSALDNFTLRIYAVCGTVE